MSNGKKEASRRNFVKSAALGVGGLALTSRMMQAAGPGERMKIVEALGETIVPSDPGDPGFKELEPHGITEEVNKALFPLGDQLFVRFNEASKPLFQNRTFVELNDEERTEFLRKVIQGKEVTDPVVRRVYRFSRLAVLKVVYANFPDDKIPRDAKGIPILAPGDGQLHQITVPKTKGLVTGWMIAGYNGPQTWEQEEKLRMQLQKVHWHDPANLEDLIVRYRPLPK